MKKRSLSKQNKVDVATTSSMPNMPLIPLSLVLSKETLFSDNALTFPGQRVITTLPVNVLQGPALKTFLPNDSLYQSMIETVVGSTRQTNQVSAKKKAHTADVWSVVMRETGLPMMVLLDGCGVHAEHQAIVYLSEELLVFADDCARYVEREAPSRETLVAWLKPRYRALDRRVKLKAEFDASFSLVMLCRTPDDGLQAVGIATGDTMALLERDNSLHTLLAACNVQLPDVKSQPPPLPFPCPDWGEATMDNTLSQLQIVIEPVEVNDTFIFLTDGAHECWPCESLPVTHNKITFLYRTIKKDTWELHQSAEALSHVVWQRSRQRFNELLTQSENATYGDDACIARVTIPTRELQCVVQKRCACEEIKQIEQLITQEALSAHFSFLHALRDAANEVLIVEAALPAITRALWLCRQEIKNANASFSSALTPFIQAFSQHDEKALQRLGFVMASHWQENPDRLQREPAKIRTEEECRSMKPDETLRRLTVLSKQTITPQQKNEEDVTREKAIDALRQAFDLSQITLEALQKLHNHLWLTAQEERLLYQMAARWYQLSATKDEEADKTNPLHCEIEVIHAMTEAEINRVFSFVREVFTREDLLWINASNMMFNLEEAAKGLARYARYIKADDYRVIQSRRQQWRVNFLHLYKQLMVDLCQRNNQHVQRFWIGEYIENVRSHLHAWQTSDLPPQNTRIDLKHRHLRHLDLRELSLEDVDVEESHIHHASLAGTGISAAQLAKTVGFSTVMDLPSSLIENAQQLSYEAWLTKLTQREHVLERLERSLAATRLMTDVTHDGKLDAIEETLRPYVQFALLTSPLINTIEHDKKTSAVALSERGEDAFCQLSQKERNNYWIALLAKHQLDLPPLLLVEGQCSRLNAFKAAFDEQGFAEHIEAQHLADLTSAQQQTLNAKKALLRLQQEGLLDQQRLAMDNASQRMISLQLAAIQKNIEMGNIQHARRGFSDLLVLTRQSHYCIDLRQYTFPKALYEGMSFEEVSLKATSEQVTHWSLSQRWSHSAALFRAIEAGDEEALREGIEERGWEVNLHNEAGRTPLMAACFKKQLSLARYLHERGANINARIQREGIKNGYTLLEGVVRLLPYEPDYQPIVDWLIEKGIRVDIKSALVLDRDTLFGIELNKQWPYNDAASQQERRALLHAAVEHGAERVVKWLIERYPDSLQQFEARLPLLHLACAEGHLAIVTLLLESAKAHDNTTIHVNRQDKQGRTALTYLAEQYVARRQSEEPKRRETVGHYPAIAEVLRQQGAIHTAYSAIILLDADKALRHLRGQINEPCDASQNTPLHIAVLCEKEETIEQLLDQKAKVDCLSAQGLTPLQLACEAQSEPMVKQLLRAGANPNGSPYELTSQQEEHLLALKASGLQEIDAFIKTFLAKGHPETPLHRAAKAGNVTLVRLLCQYKANVEATYGGKTPLHLAVQRGHQEAVKVLLHYGARITVLDFEGATPLHTALYANHTALIPCLMEAFIVQKDNAGNTALSLAKTDDVRYALQRYSEVKETTKKRQTQKANVQSDDKTQSASSSLLPSTSASSYTDNPLNSEQPESLDIEHYQRLDSLLPARGHAYTARQQFWAEETSQESETPASFPSVSPVVEKGKGKQKEPF